MRLALRFAESPSDRQAVYRLRYQIYVQELGREEAANHAARLMPDVGEPAGRLLLAEHDGEAVGALRLDWGGDAPFSADVRALYPLHKIRQVAPQEQIAILSQFVTRSEYSSGETPGQLIDAMVRFAVARNICAVLCGCRPPEFNTYSRLGFRMLRAPVNAPAAGGQTSLLLLIDDRAHIETVGSRIFPLLNDIPADATRLARLRAILPREPKTETPAPQQEAAEWTGMRGVFATKPAAQFPIFSGLASRDIVRLATMSDVIACSAGDQIVRQGAIDGTMFIILQGQADMMRDGLVVAHLEPGSVFGEHAFLRQTPHAADVVAASDAQLLALPQTALGSLIASEPRIAAPLWLNLARHLALRLDAASGAQSAAERSA